MIASQKSTITRNTIKKCKRYLRFFPRRESEEVILMLAAAGFAVNDDDLFYKYIRKITDANYLPAKLFWLAFDLIIKGELDEAKNRYALFLEQKREGRY